MGQVTTRRERRLGASDCECLRDGPVAQPVNTLTSGAYLVAGAYCARSGGGARGVYGALVAAVGVGSVAYHGPQTRGAEFLHDAPIVAIFAAGVGTPVVRVARGGKPLPGRSPGRTLGLLALSGAAAGAYAAGRSGSAVCDPESRWQWHGVWHLLSAAALTVAGEILYR